MKNLYIILTKTNTKFAKLIRLCAKQNYSHVSISLDDTLKDIYAFGRPQHNSIFLGGLVKESLDRYTLRKDYPIPIKILKIQISNCEYEWIKEQIEKIYGNSEYMYNLYSILTYPIAKGISVEHSFTCVEFAAYILQHLGYLRCKKACKCTPDYLSHVLDMYSYYEGDARDILPFIIDDAYYNKMTKKLLKENAQAFIKISKRSFHQLLS